MSEQHTTAAAPLEKVENGVEPTSTSHTTEPATASTETPLATSEPVAEKAVPSTTTADAVKTEETSVVAPTEASVPDTTAATVGSAEVKAVEPVSEGHLGYKAPGLLKQFIFSQKEFWLSDAPVTPQSLHLYLRGEKSEVAHPVAAWATHTGKGLLFFNKKGESERSHPAGIIPLYEATDLKKSAPHEFSFEINGHKHQFKATNDVERDGWYLAIEKEIELAKASKETVRGSEGYKSEMEKLNTPNVIGVAAGKSAVPKKSTEATEPRRVGSSEGEDEEGLKKSNKSRSTSRGVLNRLKGKKEEAETKREIKKEEKEEAKEEKKIEKEEAKLEQGSALPIIAGTSAPLDAPSVADRAVVAPVADEPVEALPVATTTATTANTTTSTEKPKPNKRASIFGKLPAALSGVMSPSKEKSHKEAELKPEVPPKDLAVSENAPVLPETAHPEPIETTVPTTTVTEPINTDVHEPIAAIEPTTKTADAVTPGKEKKSFLSGLPFMNKRDRSVSPSAATKDAPVKTEATNIPATEEATHVEPIEAAHLTEAPPATVPASTDETTTAAPLETSAQTIEPVDETKPIDAASPNGANKRNSVFGNLGRRASKALNRMGSTPKKENTVPGTTEAKVADESLPTTNGAATTTTAADEVPQSALAEPVVAQTEPESVTSRGVTSHTPVAASA